MMRYALEQAEAVLADWVSDKEGICDFVRRMLDFRYLNVAAFCYSLYKDRRQGDLRAVQDAFSEEIRTDLRRLESWVRFINSIRIPACVLWGISQAELAKIHEDENANFASRIADLRCGVG